MDFIWFAFLLFVVIIIVFHGGEWLTQYLYNRELCSIESLAIQQHYVIAMGCAVLEFFVESYFFPSLKEHPIICYLGLVLVIIGEIIRKTGMVTAKKAFTHYIQEKKRPGHNLIKHGIYAYIRHPGYLGWFIWAPATQLVLMNPICTVLFLFVSWHFFYDRIPYEEETLIELFGKEYEDYRRRVPSYIPFVDGIVLKK